MKYLFTTIAAVVLVGCKPSVDIHEAAEKGNIEVLKQHLDAGAQLNAKNESGWTPLIQAALGGHTEVAELLIAEGADANVMDYMGETPLHIASNYGHNEIAELLIAANANVNVTNLMGETPLHRASRNGLKKIVGLLIAEDVDVHAKSGMMGETPLHHAASYGHNEVVELLIAGGADANAILKKVKPLNNTDMNNAQIASNEDGDEKENFELTPMDNAIKFKYSDTADLLRKHGGKTAAELKAEGK